MDEGPSRPSLKRSFPEDGDSNKPPAQKRLRFPKGKKVKQGDYVVDLRQNPEDVPTGWKDPRLAAKERAMQRHRITTELCSEENREMLTDISQAEVSYENDESFVDDGIQIEPFNLEEEREQGYFDAEGNFVEYIGDNEIKDAWLDSIDIDTKFAAKSSVLTNIEDDSSNLSSEAIGKIKRRIADALEPGETVLQALRRLKGTSSGKKEKMSAETKFVFDQLTEDAMKLMEDGDYNVYDEKKEVFEREAEGYERLALVKEEGTSINIKDGKSDGTVVKDVVSSGTENGMTSSLPCEKAAGNSNQNISTAPSNDDDAFDMFGEDDETATANETTNQSGDMQNDYVYDDSSGYYYSSSLGYYYDPSSGLYCCAASGQWYSYNEETGIYDEIQQPAPAIS